LRLFIVAVSDLEFDEEGYKDQNPDLARVVGNRPSNEAGTRYKTVGDVDPRPLLLQFDADDYKRRKLTTLARRSGSRWSRNSWRTRHAVPWNGNPYRKLHSSKAASVVRLFVRFAQALDA